MGEGCYIGECLAYLILFRLVVVDVFDISLVRGLEQGRGDSGEGEGGRGISYVLWEVVGLGWVPWVCCRDAETTPFCQELDVGPHLICSRDGRKGEMSNE